jgi:hypothetical protein
MRKDLNYGNQPSNVILRTGNTLLVKPEPVLTTDVVKT